jgi:hypothetical protein
VVFLRPEGRRCHGGRHFFVPKAAATMADGISSFRRPPLPQRVVFLRSEGHPRLAGGQSMVKIWQEMVGRFFPEMKNGSRTKE